jgi:hypothetical protein
MTDPGRSGRAARFAALSDAELYAYIAVNRPESCRS